MASAEDYAAWIVANADKQGTPEFDTVQKAYEEAKSQSAVIASGGETYRANVPASDAEAMKLAMQSIASDVPQLDAQGRLIQAQQIAPQAPEPTLGDRLMGLGEAGLSLATGATTGAMGMVRGTAEGLMNLIMSDKLGTYAGAKEVERRAMEEAARATYQPTTAAGKEYTQKAGELLGMVPPVMPMGAEIAATTRGITQAAPIATAAAERVGKLVDQRVITPVEERIVRPIIESVIPPKPEAARLTAEELAKTAQKAAAGKTRATEILAKEAAPNPEVLAAADRLGIADYLQPDHVSTNQAFRELSQAVKSIPGSEARAAEIEGLQKVGQRASALVDELGGTSDVSMLESDIKKRLGGSIDELSSQADKLYGDLRNNIPAQTRSSADNVLAFLKQRAADLDGFENLSSMEKEIYRKLSPKDILDSEGKVVGQKQPTYALVDDVRKNVGDAAREKGPYKDADTGLAKKLYGLLDDDQQAVADAHGMGETYQAAKQSVRVRKGLEDDTIALFGKKLDQTMIGDLQKAMKGLSAGDSAQLVALLKAVPEDMRQRVTATGLNTAFGKSIQNGELNFNTFTRWFDGVKKNQQAYTALMSNLPADARQALTDLHTVSDSINKATRERITTGRIEAVRKELQPADTLMSTIYGKAKGAAAGAAAEAITTPMGMPGAGIAAGVASALMKDKPNVIKSADKLIASPEFRELAINATRTQGQPAAGAVRRMAQSKAFQEFAKAVSLPKDIGERQQWIYNALQVARPSAQQAGEAQTQEQK